MKHGRIVTLFTTTIIGFSVLFTPKAESAPVAIPTGMGNSEEIAPKEATIQKIERLLTTPGLDKENICHNMSVIAEQLKGAGADDYYTKDQAATLRMNVESFTPITFINTCVALSTTYTQSGMPGWQDYQKALTDISCRRGEDSGFKSLMWHASDWIGDNMYRGKLRELTENYSGAVSKTKSLDYLTRHRENFAVLSDSAIYESVRMTEMGFRTHKIPLLKKETINKKEILQDLQDGDIIILNPIDDGIDIYEIGIVKKREDGPHLIYFSGTEKQVVETEEILPRWMKIRTKHFNGYRIIRMNKIQW